MRRRRRHLAKSLFEQKADAYKRTLLQEALARHNGVKAKVAAELGLKKTAVYTLCRRLGL